MAHIHLADGAFSPEWILLWSAVLAAIFIPLFYILRGRTDSPRLVAIAAMCAAVGVAIFMVEVPTPLGPVHMSFTALIGILIGPGLGSVVMLVVNIFSAAVGHGGWSMIPANTLVSMLEVTVGYYVFKVVRTRLKVGRFWSGFSSATLALTSGALAVVFIIGVSGIQGSELDPEDIMRNTLILALLNIGTGIIEGIVTGFIVSFIGKVRPDMIGEKTPAPMTTPTPQPGGS